jgi:hypothetical protein
MKKSLFTILTSLILMLSTPSFASGLSDLNLFLAHQALRGYSAQNMVDWKVGDQMDYQVSLGMLGQGTMTKVVTKDEGNALWFKQEINLSIQNQVVEILINKADGKVLKMIRNGKEEQVPDQDLDIVGQEYAQVTVPAGTFDSIHVTANTKDVKNLEMWANPQATCMDGAIKMVVPMNFITMTSELVTFNKVK